ncbi:MAG TPA: glycoside hydrolase family 15 protein [Stellaceae bacterium]|nr:glycoside hydrolase family 15 protein [Stellaceae bacterium]
MATPFIPFPPLERTGTVGDRRTAALIAADGTVCWWCLPNYDGAPLFGALLDAGRGGYWRLGPQGLNFGHQHYHGDSAVLVTRWRQEGAVLELTDAMPWPQNRRPAGQEGRRVLLRHLRCLDGVARCTMHLEPRRDFGEAAQIHKAGPGFILACGDVRLGLWLSKPLFPDGGTAGTLSGAFDLAAGDEIWAVLGPDEDAAQWSPERAGEALAETLSYWHEWAASLDCPDARRDMIRRSAVTVHLLAFAPSGALVAAPTTSLPERIGDARNYDYRFAWVRDASLSVELLSLLGSTAEARHYLEWLAGLEAGDKMPLQVVYRIDGSRDLAQTERRELAGYRQSSPVRFGNAAAQMVERGSFGFLADCMLVYLERGGEWHDEFWHLLRRVADFTAAEWHRSDAGIWELAPERHFVASKVMAWVTLDRALRIHHRLGRHESVDNWRRAQAEIHAEILRSGWDAQRRSFRQSFDGEAIDAALLLMPLCGFLPVDDPRVCATVERIAASLTVNGFVHRFDAGMVRGQPDLPLGEAEGAFLMCTFWLAHFYALRGETERADALLRNAERIAGETGLFSEAVDARSATFLGNTPLLFSQVEYARAALALGSPRDPSGSRGAGALARGEAETAAS